MTAPRVLDGPMNGDAFLDYVEQLLVPTLRPDDIVIMDNLSAHKSAGVRAMSEDAGASLRYLPQYPPDLNPIENAFAKLKAHLMTAAARARGDLWIAVAVAAEFSERHMDPVPGQGSSPHDLRRGREPARQLS